MRLAIRGAAEAAALILSVVTTVWVGRAVGPEIFGFYAVAAVLVQLGVLVSGLGLGQTASLLVAREGAAAPRVIATVVVCRLVGAVALVMLAFLGIAALPLDPRLAILVGLSSPAWIAAAVRLDWLYVATGRMGVAAGLRLSGPVTGLVVAVTSIRSEDDVSALAALLLLPIVAPAALGAFETARSRSVQLGMVRTSPPEIRSALRQGLHFLRGELATLVTTSSDRLFLFAFATPVVVGLYDAAYRVIQPFYSIAAVVNDAFYARLAGSHAGRRVDPAVFRRYVDLSLLATIPVGFFLAVNAGPVIELLYGRPYAGAAGVLAILGWVITLGFVSGVVVYPLTAFGRPREYGDAVVAGSVSNIVLNLALIPPLAGVGAALATVVAKATSSIVGGRAFRIWSGYPIFQDLRDFSAASLIAGTASAIVRSLAGGPLGIVSFGLAYLATVWFIRHESLVETIRSVAEAGPSARRQLAGAVDDVEQTVEAGS